MDTAMAVVNFPWRDEYGVELPSPKPPYEIDIGGERLIVTASRVDGDREYLDVIPIESVDWRHG